MKKESKQLLLLPEFQKFIVSSSTGRRMMPSGRKVRTGTIVQYQYAYYLLEEFAQTQAEPLRILLLHRSSLRLLQKEKNYWNRFYKKFSLFLYFQKKYYDRYVSHVFKIIKTFFNYLTVEKSFPIGEFHRRFRIHVESFTPVILSPTQLRYLIIDKPFEESLPLYLQRIKDIFVFGCTVALRYQDLMQLKKDNIQYNPESVSVVLHTQKTGAEIKVPLPGYAIDIVNKYSKKAGRFVLPRIAGPNLNLHIKTLMKKAGWDYVIPKVRHKQNEPVEIKTKAGKSFRFYDHITAHTMRRTAITTLLLMGVEETFVRRISGHAPGSKEFYRYVVVVQDYLNVKVKEAHIRLLKGEEFLT